MHITKGKKQSEKDAFCIAPIVYPEKQKTVQGSRSLLEGRGMKRGSTEDDESNGTTLNDNVLVDTNATRLSKAT